MADIRQSDRMPFRDSAGFRDKNAWATANADGLTAQKNSFWYLWHSLGSSVTVEYGSIQGLLSKPHRYEIVLAGAITEHLADPVTAIGAAARLAKEMVIVAFTPVHDSDDEFLKPLVPWDNPAVDYVWWAASRGLYRRVFDNMGFDIECVPCTVSYQGEDVPRQTIIARRR